MIEHWKTVFQWVGRSQGNATRFHLELAPEKVGHAHLVVPEVTVMVVDRGSQVEAIIQWKMPSIPPLELFDWWVAACTPGVPWKTFVAGKLEGGENGCQFAAPAGTRALAPRNGLTLT